MVKAAVNSHCPWSGNPVSDSALTTYRDQTVGFCNPGCRNKFDRATHHFDEVIAQQTEPNPSQGTQGTDDIYLPRRFRSAGLIASGPVTFKTYLIDRTSDPLAEEEAIASFMPYTEGVPELSSEPHDTVGHVIIHRGDEADWLLIHWWIPGAILSGVVAKSGRGELQFERITEPLLACVWEQVVMAYERQAWINHMMRGSPDRNGFLADTLPDGLY